MTNQTYVNSDMTTTVELSLAQQWETLYAIDKHVCKVLHSQDKHGAILGKTPFMTTLRHAASAYITIAGEDADIDGWIDSFDEMYSDRIREALRG